MKIEPFYLLISLFSLACVGMYFLMKPGFDETMRSVPPGMTLNIVTPTTWLVYGFFIFIVGVILSVFFAEYPTGGTDG